jgi:hypothetical protein
MNSLIAGVATVDRQASFNDSWRVSRHQNPRFAVDHDSKYPPPSSKVRLLEASIMTTWSAGGICHLRPWYLVPLSSPHISDRQRGQRPTSLTQLLQCAGRHDKDTSESTAAALDVDLRPEHEAYAVRKLCWLCRTSKGNRAIASLSLNARMRSSNRLRSQHNDQDFLASTDAVEQHNHHLAACRRCACQIVFALAPPMIARRSASLLLVNGYQQTNASPSASRTRSSQSYGMGYGRRRPDCWLQKL